MPRPLENTVALITAGTSGLSLAIAHRLAAAQARIALNYATNTPRATAALASLNALPHDSDPKEDRHILLQGDAGSAADVAALVARTVDAFGRLDVVVSNVGWTRRVEFAELEENLVEEDWDRAWAVNVKAHLWLFAAARGHLERSGGVFVSTASVAGVRPSGSSMAYAVSKAAQIHLMKALAMVSGPRVRVNCVSPGFMMTDWVADFPPEKIQQAREGTVLKRLATPEDVAEQVVALVRSYAITGQNVVIDGGFSL